MCCKQVLCLVSLLPLTYLVRWTSWKTFLDTQNDKCISFSGTPSVICVFFSPFSPPKEKKGFHSRRDRCCMSLHPQCHLELLLSFCFVSMEDSLWGWWIWALYLQIFSSLLFLYIVVPSILFCKLERGNPLPPEAVPWWCLLCCNELCREGTV